MWECDFCRIRDEKNKIRYFGGTVITEEQGNGNYHRYSFASRKMTVTYQWLNNKKLGKCECVKELGSLDSLPKLFLHAFLLTKNRVPTTADLNGHCILLPPAV
jgi:hypothetical protein